MFKISAAQSRIVILVVGFLLAIGGILLLRRGSAGLGLALTALGIGGYLWASFQIQKQGPTPDDMRGLKAYALPALIGFLTIGSAFTVFYLLTDAEPSATTNYWANNFWVLSILLMLVLALRIEGVRWPKKADIRNWWASNRTEFLIILGLILLATLARTVDLGVHPYPWSGDEASVGIEGQRILNGEVTNFFDTGWSGQPNWSFVPTALSLTVFGDNIIGVRMVSAAAGILAVVFVYLLGREMFNKQVGLLAAGFLVLYPIHVHFSRIGVNNINDGFMVVFVLWLVFRAIRTETIFDYTLAGVATGLTIYTYVGTRLVLIMAIGTLIYMCLVRRGFFRTQLKGFGFYLAAMMITAAPMAYYFAQHPDIFINRIGQEGILFNGWLGQHAIDTGQSVVSVLLEQLSRSTMVFIAHGAPGNFFNSPQPYLTVLGAILFLLGMVYSFSRLRDSQNVVLLGWFWSVVLLGGVLTLNPPSNTRMVMTAPAVALFVGIGLWQLGEVLARLNVRPFVRASAVFALVAFLSLENGLFYFAEYRDNYYFQDASAELAMEAGLQLNDLGSNYSLFVLGYPRVYSDFPTLTFLAAENPKSNPTPEELESIFLLSGQGALFVVIPENVETLVLIQNRFPDGVLSTVQRKATENEVLYYSYVVAPNGGP